MTTIEDLESRVRLLEAAGRGEVIELRRDVEAFRHETRRELTSLVMSNSVHSMKLSDLDTKVDMLTEMVAELRRLIMAKSDGASE